MYFLGNSKSLKLDPAAKSINVHERLKEFRKRMYSAHYMTLVVQSRGMYDKRYIIMMMIVTFG